MSLFNLRRRILVVMALLPLSALVVVGNKLPQSDDPDGGKLIQLTGRVSVNGTSAISGATVFSDSTITTAARSSAVVSLGKLGRVEVFPSSTMKLSFDDPDVSLSMLDAGRVRVSSSSNVNASITTNDGKIVSTGKQRNEFIVDTKCGNTFVAVKKGTVELRAGSAVKEIAAGSQDTAGQARPGCTPARG